MDVGTGGAQLQLGTLFAGKYRIEGVLGEGGMGIVVRARHLLLDSPVAIKLLREEVADIGSSSRFLREAQAAAMLKSEHVAQVIDVGSHEGVPYIVMELLEGQDLGALLHERGKLPTGEAIALVLQACEGLAVAHANGIVHRDVKPSNLVAASVDGELTVKIVDFGISKITRANVVLTQTMSVFGSPAYMSPEQMRSAKNVDFRTDIWSIGAVLYQLIEGHVPFHADNLSEMAVKVSMDPFEPMELAPPQVAAVIAGCLAKHPDERFATMGELGEALAPFSARPAEARELVERMHRSVPSGRSLRFDTTPVPVISAVAVETPPPIESAPRPSSRRRRVGLAVGSALIVASAVAALAIHLRRDQPAAATPSLPAQTAASVPTPTPTSAPIAAPAPAPAVESATPPGREEGASTSETARAAPTPVHGQRRGDNRGERRRTKRHTATAPDPGKSLPAPCRDDGFGSRTGC